MAALQYVDISGYAALLIRDTYTNLVMPGALISRAQEWLGETDAKWDEKEKTWHFPTYDKLKNGKLYRAKDATITFGYLEKKNDHLKYKSAEFQFIGFDEATDLRWKQVIYLFSRLRKLKGHKVPLRFRLASNPGGISHNDIKNKYVDPKTRKKGVAFIPAGLNDNPYLDEDEYRDSLSNLDSITREQLLNGDWNVKKDATMFRRDYWQLTDQRWLKSEIGLRVRYWDLAATDEKTSASGEPCYTAGTKMVINKDKRRCMIEDVIRIRKEPGIVEKTVRQTADLDEEDTITIIEQDPGQAGKWQMFHFRNEILYDKPFKKVLPSGSKVIRAMPLSSRASDGYIYLLKGHWNNAFIDEGEDFPEGEFKDQIDSASGAHKELFGTVPGGVRIRSIGGTSRLRGKR